ncbi:MAG: hypothetical protein AAGD04_14805 [Pseudomonadota bacterium]
MIERQAPRPQDPNDTFRFWDHQIPELRNGAYTLNVTSTLDADGSKALSGTRAMQFKVAGPQLVFPPNEIVATFPANLARGKFHSVLPHVTLERATLPWERVPSSKANASAPWLLLLVLSDDEVTNHVKRKVVQVGKNRAWLKGKGIDHQDADPEALAHVATLSSTLVAQHFPEFKDLKWLAHVRQLESAHGGHKQPMTATLVSPNLPEPGVRNHAFVVSIEGRYGAGAKPSGALTVPVLHEWSFFCQEDPTHSLNALLMAAMGPTGAPPALTVPPQDDTPAALGERLKQGYVPVEHHMRRGDLSAAWYRGPLSPGKAPKPTKTQKDHLPATHSDGLLSLDEDFGMINVSYASAWELGRLLMLEHTDLATELYHWKRSHAQASHMAKRKGNADPLPEMPEHLAEWIQHHLLELRAVPFSYLVPDAEMLPPESFRFFDLDPFWLDCLRDGALAVGRTDTGQHAREKEMRKHQAEPPEMSGFLLRSAAVADFPHLEVDGYDTDLSNSDRAPAGTPASKILRFERLSRDVLMVLFEGRIRTADLHLHPQAVHFGFLATEHGGKHVFEKHIRNVSPHPNPIPVDPGPPGKPSRLDGRRVKMDDLAKDIIGHISGASGPVSKFALQMIEGVELVRFRRKL